MNGIAESRATPSQRDQRNGGEAWNQATAERAKK
jgi:hypothetical protein